MASPEDSPSQRARQQTAAGAFYAAAGLLFAWKSTDYPMGQAGDMGPGYFPFWLGVVLAAIGLVVVVRHGPQAALAQWLRLKTKATTARVRVPPLVIVLLSMVGFGFFVDHAGVVLSTAGLVFTASLASTEFTWRRALACAVVVSAFSSLLFVVLLGLQMPLWPSFAASFGR